MEICPQADCSDRCTFVYDSHSIRIKSEAAERYTEQRRWKGFDLLVSHGSRILTCVKEMLIQDSSIGERLSTSGPRTAREKALSKAFSALPESYPYLLLHDDRRWWEYFSPSPINNEPVRTTITCAEGFGAPNAANCESVILELMPSGSSSVTLDPALGPLIKVSGNCAIGIESTSKQTTTWDTIRRTAETLQATCIENPVSGVIGGFAVSHAMNMGLPSARIPKRQSEPVANGPNVTISMYLQDSFSGPARNTCAWEAVSSHTGDVRQCPATTSPWRPPERRLGDNSTAFEEWQRSNETVI